MIATKQQLTRFSLLQGLYWMYIATFAAFLVAMLSAQGVPADKLGIMVSVMTIGSCIGQFVVANLSDRLSDCKHVFLIFLSITHVLHLLLFFTTNTVVLYILMFVVGFSRLPLGAILDTWFIKGVSDSMRTFGQCRSWGSIGYAVTALLFGSVVSAIGYAVMPIMSTTVFVVLFILAFKTPDIEHIITDRKKGANSDSMRKLIPASLILLFVGATFAGGSNSAYNNMLPVIVASLGGTTAHQGIMMFVNASMEVPAMNIPWERLKISITMRIIISAVLFIISMFIMSFATNVWQIVLLMAVTGMAYGMHLQARRGMVAELSPRALQSTMHGIGDMLYSGFSPIITNVLSGYIIVFSGVRLMLQFCVLLHILALISYLFILAKQKKAIVQ